MPRITFISKNRKNKGITLNNSELLSLYFYGIDIQNIQGTTMNQSTVELWIKSAQNEIERYLSIKINKQLIEERSDYFKNEFTFNGFIRTKLPVNYPVSVEGKFGDQTVAKYPAHWLTVNRTSTFVSARQIVMVPNSNISEQTLNNAFFGATSIAMMGLHTRDTIGSFWDLKYLTGFEIDELPSDIINLIGKLASIPLLETMGDLILGKPGISNYSVSIDGLSQSIGTPISGTTSAFGARISEYKKEILDTINSMKSQYQGVLFTAI